MQRMHASTAQSATTPASTPVPLKQEAAVIGLVGLAHATSHFSHLLLAPLFPVFMKDFGLSYSDVGLLMSIFFIISGSGQAVAGLLARGAVVDAAGGAATSAGCAPSHPVAEAPGALGVVGAVTVAFALAWAEGAHSPPTAAPTAGSVMGLAEGAPRGAHKAARSSTRWPRSSNLIAAWAFHTGA